jgi:hypothetical protein
MLSIILVTPPIAVSAFPLCLIVTIRVSSKFGALRERFHEERIWPQVLKILREEYNIVRELRRAQGVA